MKKISGIIIISLFFVLSSNAQNLENNKLDNSNRDAKTQLNEMKGNDNLQFKLISKRADNNIKEVSSEFLYDIGWVKDNISTYQYSENWQIISVLATSLDVETDIWSDESNSVLTLDEKGFPVTFEVNSSNNSSTTNYDYDEDGRIITIKNQGEFTNPDTPPQTYTDLTTYVHITADSIEYEQSSEFIGGINVLSGYFRQKDGNLKRLINGETPDGTPIIERITHFDTSLEEQVRRFKDPFYGPAFIRERKQGDVWVPSIQQKVTRENGLLKEVIFGFFVNGVWSPDSKTTYQQENGKIVHVEKSLFQNMEWLTNIRIDYSYDNSVSIEPDDEVQKFNLRQNYPNPFNPSSTIAFTLGEPQEITLQVYNMLGKEVADLQSGMAIEGSHKVAFTGSNLPSGLYYYVLKGDKFTETKAMTLIK